MTSNMSCVGLRVGEDPAEIGKLLASPSPVEMLGEWRGTRLARWQDESGARLVISYNYRDGVDFLPSFAAASGARLAQVAQLTDDLATADVVDADGDQLTAMTFELEQRLFLSGPVDGFAGITALGLDVTVHADAAAFAAADASLLNPDADPDSEPPAHFVELGWAWPQRLAAESFMSYGIFAGPDDASAHARLSGVVRHADRRTVAATGQDFTAARVQTVGFEATVCLDATDHPTVPQPGQVIPGTVYLVASLDSLTAPARHRPRLIGRIFRSASR
jgi:hypothetical protein